MMSPLDIAAVMDNTVIMKQSAKFIVNMLFRIDVQGLIGTGLMQYIIVTVIAYILGCLVFRWTMKMVFVLSFYGLVIITFYGLISITMKATTMMSPLDINVVMDNTVIMKQSAKFIVNMLFRIDVQGLIQTGLMQYVIMTVIAYVLGCLVFRWTKKLVIVLSFYGSIIVTFCGLIFILS